MKDLFGVDGVAPHDRDLALVGTYYDAVALSLAEGILHEAGISFMAKDRGAGGVLHIMTGQNFLGTDLFVRQEQLELALQLLTPTESMSEKEADEE